MNRNYSIYSNSGDLYRLSLSDDGGLEVSRELSEKYNLKLISIELVRVSGSNITSTSTLGKIEDLIAQTFEDYPDSILVYYCDFLNPIPASTKIITPQEYRSRLFSLMFQRYMSSHNDIDANEVVIRIEGIEEPYFVHLIARKEHLQTVVLIASEIQSQYEK